MQETWVRSLGGKDPLEKEMATCSSILAWEIPWTEELAGYVHGVAKSRTWLNDQHTNYRAEGPRWYQTGWQSSFSGEKTKWGGKKKREREQEIAKAVSLKAKSTQARFSNHSVRKFRWGPGSLISASTLQALLKCPSGCAKPSVPCFFSSSQHLSLSSPASALSPY